MLVKMSKIEIVGAKELLADVLQKLHEHGCLHIEDISHEAEIGNYFIRPVQIDEKTESRKLKLEKILVKINSMLDSLPVVRTSPGLLKKLIQDVDKDWGQDNDGFLDNVQKTIDTSEKTIRELSKEKKELLAEQSNSARYKAVMIKVAPLAGRMVALENYNSIALLVEKKFASLVDVIRKEIDQITDNQSHIVADDVDEKTIAMLVVFNNKYTQQVKSFVSGETVNEVVVPEKLESLPYDQALKHMEKRQHEIIARLKKISAQLEKMSGSLFTTLLAQKTILRNSLDELDVLSQFGATDFSFIILGWMPSKVVADCKQELQNTFDDSVYMEELHVTEKEAENAPIEYVHSALTKPFEPIVHMFGTPRYGTVDPVPLVAVFFPLFFGIILGDMGYALILLGIALYLHLKKKDNPTLHAVSIILFLSGVSSLFFGLLYGEFFGEIGKHLAINIGLPSHIHTLFGIELPWDRRHLLVPTLLFAIGLGAAHVVLGLILGIINARRAHSRKHMLEKGAILVALIALTPIIFAMITDLPNRLTTPGWLLLIATIPVLIYSAGVMGPIEVLGTISNIVSYVRIMAIGLVSVILAETANEIGGQFSNVVIGVLIAVLIHALNLAIHVFTPSLHVLRLNFVEFFGKFYEPGGTRYKPFKRKGG